MKKLAVYGSMCIGFDFKIASTNVNNNKIFTVHHALGKNNDDDDLTEVVPNNQKKQKTFNQESTQNNEYKTLINSNYLIQNFSFLITYYCYLKILYAEFIRLKD
ncbi:hypothetical protein BpHYR1_025084 [Brachionus plicatilis]|uniref:Uncharacterized protein n=1 Tax=Brachionus plicatilis TaxID=10195 RepID=A0A3M7RHA4_BRAPC|nr:hypothetical protein BpHYR1_025084 [Brachionus plicatilis]